MKTYSQFLKKTMAIMLSLALVFTMMPMVPGAVQKVDAAELLPAPTITVDANGVATWTEVEGASEYSVTVGSGGGWNDTRSYNIPENLADWDNPAGTYTFRVYAVDSSGNQISEEAAITYEYTPTHIHIWSDEWTIEGAYHWHECTAEDCPVDVDSFKKDWDNHKYDASGVCVCGNELAIKPAPTITVDENGVATWTEVVGAADYSCDIDVGNSIIDTDEERSFDIKGWLDTNEKEAGVYTFSVYARNSSTETCSEVAKAYYAYNVEVIDRLNIDYTTDKANPSATECDLVQELRDVDGATISNGTKDVGYCQNVYLFSYTEPDRGGTRTQIENDNTDFIDPDLYYYASFEINARSGFDFMHDGTTFDTSSVKIFINGVETGVLWDEYYNKYWKGIEFYVPIEIDTSNKVYSVEITNSENNVAKDSTLQMNKNIASYGEGYDAVTWSVEGAEKAGTTISGTGLLTVAADETATTLTVRATATKDSTKFDTITLNVVDEIKIESVSITPSVTSDFVREGHQFTATVIGNDALDVIWTLAGNTSSDTKITPNAHTCYLEIGKYETAEALTLTATSVKDPTKSATATITVKQSNIIDKLYIDYTTDNFYVGNTAYELLKELSALKNKSVSNGTEDVGTVFNVYLKSNTEADGSGEGKQIGPDDTDLINLNLYYFAKFEIRAKIGFDFKHDGSTFDTSSLDVFVNETEMDGVAEADYNDYWGIIDIVVPLGQGPKINIATSTITLSQYEYDYDGTQHKPEVTVKMGETSLVEGTDYEVEYAQNTEAGNGYVTVKGKGKYEGESGKAFAIKSISIEGKTITLDQDTFAYTGTAQGPTITVKDGEQTLVAGTDYTISGVTTGTEAGTYNFTITGKGNYKGTVEKSFTINPCTHTWDAGTVTKKPTCSEVGTMKYTCTVPGCDGTKTEPVPIDKDAHPAGSIVDLPAKAATCKETGLTAGKQCTACGTETVKQTSVPKLTTHTYDAGVVTTAPTCKTEGVKTYTCEVCDGTKTEPVPIDKDAHPAGSIKDLPAKAATLTATGLTAGKQCADCGEKLVQQNTIKAIGTVKLSYEKKVYTGKTLAAPKLTVTDTAGKALVSGTDYTVTGLVGKKSVGRYKVTVTFKGSYAGSTDLYFNIVPKKTTSAKAVLYGYDDIKFSWSKVTGASGYLVSYKKGSGSWSKAVATTGTSYKKANLSDGVKYTFKVVPYYKEKNGTTKYYDANQYKTAYTYTLKKVSGVKVAKSGTKVKVSWTNISGESGYQISKMTKKSATQKKPLTYKTTSGKYKKLSATKGKTYYYKVRAYKTVNGKNIYGPWSTVKAYKRK